MFRINKLTRAIAPLLIASAVVGAGSVGAFAITTSTTFNSVVPRFQQSHYWVYQNKTTQLASQVNFSSIGASYLMNVKSQNGASGKQYTEATGIGTGSNVNIANGTPVGTATRLIVTNNTWALVDVVVTGSFKTN
jgi:hypothetical protein